MSPSRLLLCTDLDRTLIPNGPQPEHPAARKLFREFSRLPGVVLVYVTGRHQELVKQAIADYDLPEPDFAITDVGTQICRIEDGKWQEMSAYTAEIAKAWLGHSREQIQVYLSPRAELRLQEASKQKSFKLSYYLALELDKEPVLNWVKSCLSQKGVNASLVWSIDELENRGLLDVLPRNATKLHGIQFLQQQLGFQQDEVVFAGDSGNDLAVLGSAIPAILVANASAEVRRQAQQLAAQNGQTDSLYLATDTGSSLGGDYAAGILQGLWHFAPQFRAKLTQMEPSL
jgi:hypothetical protein